MCFFFHHLLFIVDMINNVLLPSSRMYIFMNIIYYIVVLIYYIVCNAVLIMICVARLLKCFRLKALHILFDIATKNQGIPEQYNMHLHALDFKPLSILNRMDAALYSIQFIRFVCVTYCVAYCVIYSLSPYFIPTLCFQICISLS